MAPPERPRRAPRSPQARAGAPRRATGGKPPFKAREDGPKKPYQRRDDGPKKPYQRRDDGPKKPYQRRDDGPKKPYQRRDDGPKKPYQRRDDGPKKPYQRRDERPVVQERPVPKKWGGVTRRGARQVTNPTALTDEAKAYEKREFSRAARPEVDRWERDDRPAARKPAAPRKTPKKGPPPRTKALPADVVAEVASAAANPRRAPMLQKRLADAARHLQHGREQEAVGILRALAQEVPEAASVRELYGQALYGLGRYKQAAAELEAFIELTHGTEQHPMLADCYRALGRHKKVHELWAELRESSPSPDIVAEGRIVTAGSLADQGKLSDAVKLLEAAPPVRGRVAERHMRTWYALADLYERSGELSKGRALFTRVVQHDSDFADAADRLHALG
jgi:tetratricopeptide (TPR) repeat protein